MNGPKTRFRRTDAVVCVFLIAGAAMIFLPGFGVETEKAQLTACQSNLRVIWNGLELYCADYDGYFPPATVGRSEGLAQRNMMYFLWPDYVEEQETFHCPADSAYWRVSDGRQSYSYFFEFGFCHVQIHKPATVSIWGGTTEFCDLSVARIMMDGEPWISRDGAYFDGVPGDYRRHFESTLENCLYLDGHVSARNTHWPDDDPMNYWAGPASWESN